MPNKPKPQFWPPDDQEFELSYIADSGAGRTILSQKELVRQGVPKSIIHQFTQDATTPINFFTGGGERLADKSVGLTSGVMGRVEGYLLEDSPFAVSMGQVVQMGRPFVWLPGELPFHVTDTKHLKLSCPRQFRLYADRLDENVPIFKEKVKFGYNESAEACPNIFGNPEVVEAGDAGDRALHSDAPVPSPGEASNPAPQADLVSVPDVLLDNQGGSDSELDISVRYRDMSEDALRREALSPGHLLAHHPHNPFCETCRKANMRQRRFGRKSGRDSDKLPPVNRPLERLGADSIIVAKTNTDGTRISGNGASTIATITDFYTGIGIAVPLANRTTEAFYKHLKHFVGASFNTKPNLVVKSDAAKEITNAVSQLGWHSEPSLENRWPHNAAHERWVGTLKSSIRSSMLQSGFPVAAWDLCCSFAAVALSIVKAAPIHEWERSANGSVLPEFADKQRKTCWELHFNERFPGPRQPFGRLCFYLHRDVSRHPMAPSTRAGLFVGWRLESGLRYRNVVWIADYESCRKGDFNKRFVKSVPEQEVHYPLECVFPFAEARDRATKELADAKAPAAMQDIPQLFDAAEVELHSGAPPPEPVPIKFKITMQRVADYGMTPGCRACENPFQQGLLHTKECRDRFRHELEQAGEIKTSLVRKVEAVSDAEEPKPFLPSGNVSEDPPAPFISQDEDVAAGLFGDFSEDENHPSDNAVVDAFAEELLGSGEGTAPAAISQPSQASSIRAPLQEKHKPVGDVHYGAPLPDLKPEPKTIQYEMGDYCRDAVTLYREITGITKLKKVPTPFLPEGALPESGDDQQGELSSSACKILMKALWLARLSRPDCSKAIGDLATHVQKWSKNDDRKVHRLICYLDSTQHYVLTGRIGDRAKDLVLRLFVDSDFAGSTDNARSTSGGWLVLAGPSTWVPLMWVSKRQACTSRSTTEAEIISLAMSLYAEAIPTLDLWDTLLSRPVDLIIMEDNQACIKILRKGYSDKMRSLLRTHRVNVSAIKECLDEDQIQLVFVETDKQVADIFTKALCPLKWPAALDLMGMDTTGESHSGAPPAKAKANAKAKSKAAVSFSPHAEIVPIPNKDAQGDEHTECSPCELPETPQDELHYGAPPAGLRACLHSLHDIYSMVESDSQDGSAEQIIEDVAPILESISATPVVEVSQKQRQGLKGYGTLFEVCTSEKSNLGMVADEFRNVTVHRITQKHDLGNSQFVKQFGELLESLPGCSLHGSLPCTVWSVWQYMAVHRYGPDYQAKLDRRRAHSVLMLRNFIKLADICLANGGQISFEWPRYCTGWLRKELLEFIHKYNLHSVFVDGCAVGMTNPEGVPIKKEWRFITSHRLQAYALSRLWCSCSQPHGEIAGGVTKKTESYPVPLCRIMLGSLFGVKAYTATPSLACDVHSGCTQAHREHETTVAEFGASHQQQPLYVETSAGELHQGAPLSYQDVLLAVHKLLTRKEMLGMPKALEAVRAEGEGLVRAETWLLNSVVEKVDLIATAKENNQVIHLADLMTIASIKHAELDPSKQKMKGRIVFRGDAAKDQDGSLAVFQELSSSPSTINGINTNLAYGMLPGHASEQADALQAYVQCVLKSKHPTYVRIPRELWPQSWIGKYTAPYCKLNKSLYGHPESGAHWQAHLTEAIKRIGGKDVPNHPSTFFFPETRVLLTVYVDDLLASGPKDNLAPFWKQIAKEIDLGEPEPINRFLGRNHHVRSSPSSSSSGGEGSSTLGSIHATPSVCTAKSPDRRNHTGRVGIRASPDTGNDTYATSGNWEQFYFAYTDENEDNDILA